MKMSLQSRDLIMVGLGSLGDQPVNRLQEPLVDAVHLRWAFRRERGFPWFGFFLLRRRWRQGDPRCLSVFTTELPEGAWPERRLPTPAGELSSDANLVLTDDFPPAGQVEFDLQGRSFLRLTLPDDQPARRFVVRVGFRAAAQMTVTLSLWGVAVQRLTLNGRAGEVVEQEAHVDAATSVEVSGGVEAALVDLCHVPVSQDATVGWERVPGAPDPFCLPVTHDDYPCSGNRPVDVAAAENVAVNRIVYGLPDPWRGVPFADLHEQLVALVAGGPGSTPMAERSTREPGVPTHPAADGPQPDMPTQRPLDLVLLGALHPPVAQMLGLYWADQTPGPQDVYDYLVVADGGRFSGDSAALLRWLDQTPDPETAFRDVDAYIVYRQQLEPTAPLDRPRDLRAYALPASTARRADGTLSGEVNAVGLRWDLDRTGEAAAALRPGAAVLQHLWRSDLGDDDPPAAPTADRYQPLTKDRPILVATLRGTAPPTAPQDWPPLPLHATDAGLADGWYSYRVSGVDVFGRHSPLSQPCEWFQWAPQPLPRPWYYQDPAGHRRASPAAAAFAVRLLDKVPPPFPTGIEAACLDPEDPTVLRDEAYDGWRASMRQALGARGDAIVGLRARWVWTEAHQDQAPDLREFRIYLQPGRINALTGRITAVAAVSDEVSDVTTDRDTDEPADRLAGTTLQVGMRGFDVVGSVAGAPLRLRVHNRRNPDGSPLRPPDGAACSVVLPDGQALHTDYGDPASWTDRYYVVHRDDPWTPEVDEHNQPTGARIYEVFIPQPGDAFTDDLPLAPALAEPVAYGQVGVTAADDKDHTPDHPRWAALPPPRDRWAGRPGNEGRVGPPATIYRVWRQRPDPPVPPPDAERVFATLADYHGKSYYTLRWRPTPHLKAHVFRALDEAVFNADWQRRDWTRALSADDDAFFPDLVTEPRWNQRKREQVTAELNALKTLRDGGGDREEALALYRGLSNDALRVLAGLPWTAAAFTQLTTSPLDPADPATANRRGPADPDDFQVGQAGNPLADAGLRVYVDTLDGRSRNRYFYRAAYVDAAHNLSDLGPSGPPVWLPKVVPPRTPVLTRVLGGDRRIMLRWASNREPDLASYRVYRAETQAAARDVRMMTLRHTEPVPAGDPGARPAQVEWADEPVPGLTDFWYALAAVDGAGNVSAPTVAVKGRAFDEALPQPPVPQVAWVDVNGRLRARVAWQSDDEMLLQRRGAEGGPWMQLGTWRAPGAHDVADPFADAARSYEYRLRARRPSSGAVANGQSVRLDAAGPA